MLTESCSGSVAFPRWRRLVKARLLACQAHLCGSNSRSNVEIVTTTNPNSRQSACLLQLLSTHSLILVKMVAAKKHVAIVKKRTLHPEP
jgi:hypothetical protein